MKTITILRRNLLVLATNRSIMHKTLDEARQNLLHMHEKGVNMKQLRESRRSLDYLRFQCILCSEDCKKYQHFMVTDELWEQYVGHENVCMCMPCFEQILGREIEEKDLKRSKTGAHLLINYPLLEEPEPVTLIVDNENERAKQVASNEEHYKAVLDRLLTPEQKESLKEADVNGTGNAYGVTSDPTASVKKRAVEAHKRRGYHQGKRKK